MGWNFFHLSIDLWKLLVIVMIAVALAGGAPSVFAFQSESEMKSEEAIKQEKKNVKTQETEDDKKSESKSRISDEKKPLQIEDFPQRPRPILELGQNFLGTGTLPQGLRLPTGAVWQPYFMMFGTYRSGLQSFDDGSDQLSEWANRFDLFGNLYLTFTERFLVGVRPLDKDGRFTGVNFQPENESVDEFNFDITTLFFEGVFDELFPILDKDDKRGLDYGFAVGRQPISFQEGLLINDNLDAVGITKINWKIPTAVNFRWTLLYAWNELNRKNLSRPDKSSSLVGLFSETDWRRSTVAADVIYVNGDGITGDGLFAGFSAVQRIGRFNSSIRIVGSFPVGEGPVEKDRIHNNRGAVLFSELSWTPHGNNNLVYINGFWGIDHFRSASRAPEVGGPLGRMGLLFAAVGMGRYGAPLSNEPDDAVGGLLGYQMFFSNTRQQLSLEIGGRYSTNNTGQRAIAGGARYQMALGRRWVVRLDGFASFERERDVLMGDILNLGDDEFRLGGRLELLTNL